MSIVTVLAAVAVIAALTLGGVITININTEKLAGLPSTAMELAGNKAFFEKQKTIFISLKRKAELFVTEKEEDKIDLMLTFANEDVKALDKQLQDKAETEELLPRADLLITSLQQIGEQAQKTSVDHLASLKNKSQEIFIAAEGVLSQLQDREAELAYLKDDLNSITSELQQSIGQFKKDKQPAVAGAEDNKEEATPAPTPTASSKIPLKF